MAHTAETEIDAFFDTIDPTALRDGSFLRDVAAAHQQLRQAETALNDAVARSRAAGDSWSMIGLVLGTSKQNAHRKFGQN